MRFLKIVKYLSLLAAVGLVAAAFLTWVTIVSKNISITGMNTTGTDFGKPGSFHIVMAVLFVIFSFVPRVWAKRLNLLIAALNIAWAIRNFFMIPACSGGECPVKEIGMWLVLVSSVVLMIGALFPDVELENRE